MPKRVLNISESSSIALHAARALVRAESPMTSAEIAEESGVSRHHLSKVLRKMVEAGIVSALKGPNGGFYFTEEQKNLPLMRIMEATGSGVASCDCMFDTSRCEGKDCLFGSLLSDVNKLYNEYFSKTKIFNLTKNNNRQNKE